MNHTVFDSAMKDDVKHLQKKSSENKTSCQSQQKQYGNCHVAYQHSQYCFECLSKGKSFDRIRIQDFEDKVILINNPRPKFIKSAINDCFKNASLFKDKSQAKMQAFDGKVMLRSKNQTFMNNSRIPQFVKE